MEFVSMTFRASLDEGPGSHEIKQSYLDESHKLDPQPLNESSSKKWQLQAKPTWHHFRGKINWSEPKKKKELKGKARDLKN